MRASPAEYLRLDLRAHDLLRDVPLYDVSVVHLPGGGAGRSVADILALESAAAPSRVANAIYGLRHFLGRPFGWDRVQMRPEDSLLSRLSERDRRDSEITPGTPVGSFLLLYQFPGEALRETSNATVHGFLLHCTGAHRERVPPVLGGIRDPRFLAHATVSARDRAVSTHPVPGYASPDSARVARRLWSHRLGLPNLIAHAGVDKAPSRGRWLGSVAAGSSLLQ
jgi:hypothetical protein